MSNEPVDTGTQMEGPDELEEQQEQSAAEPTVNFRLKPQEVTFYRRMADYFWRSGVIK
jgi:hypothetical protein